MRESELRSEEERYAALLHELDMIKRNGIMEQDNQSKKIQDSFNLKFEEKNAEAERKAEKNISEIERNIQAQN